MHLVVCVKIVFRFLYLVRGPQIFQNLRATSKYLVPDAWHEWASILRTNILEWPVNLTDIVSCHLVACELTFLYVHEKI